MDEDYKITVGKLCDLFWLTGKIEKILKFPVSQQEVYFEYTEIFVFSEKNPVTPMV